MDAFLSLFDQLTYILLGGCVLFLLLQWYFILLVHGKLAFHRPKSAEQIRQDSSFQNIPLSVIICVRNQEELIRESLPAILEQDYPNFEVVVVNDRSEDDTKWVLKELSAKHAHLKVVDIAEHIQSQQGKKFGVAMGIKAATYEHLVFTDIDCIPATNQWLLHMSNGFSGQKEIVLGYVPLKRKSGFSNAMIRFRHFYQSINYLSYALKKNAFMGLGQNLAFRKELFFKGKGFASHIHVHSGYDDLTVNQHATRSNTTIAIHKDAHVWKPMPKSIEAYRIQKKWQQQAFQLYKSKHKFQLGFQKFTSALFYCGLLSLLVYNLQAWPFVLGIYLLRLLAQYAIYIPIAKKLRITRTLWFLPIMDVFYTFSR